MKTITKNITAEFYSFAELPEDVQALLEGAKEVRLNAQAPYSHFWCGAAIEFESGEISAGCNCEVASYTQTSHAEQNALTGHISQHGKSVIKQVAVVAAHESVEIDFAASAAKEPERFEDAAMPCGHCMQTLWENCNSNPNVPIWIYRQHLGMVSKVLIGDGFPLRFGPDKLIS